MQDYTIYNFEDLITDRRTLKDAALILGNGASISVNNCFNYTNLFDKACGNSILDQTSKALFEALETTDFELVMNKLRQAYVVNKVLNLDSNDVAFKTYDNIRRSLISAVKETHVKFNDVIFQIEDIRKFLEQFNTVISFNYDLLVYWAIMASYNSTAYKMKDCFIKNLGSGILGFEYDIKMLREPYQGIQDPTLVFYPHGNLMLASNENNEEFKIKLNSQNNLFDEIGKKWRNNYVPLFVSEGDSKQKLKAIKRSTYLNFVYENILPDLGKVAVIYGWRLAEQEEHLIKKIFHTGSVETVFVSIYLGDNLDSDKVSTEQERIVRTLKRGNSNLDIRFFDAASRNCWCNSN